MKKHPNVLVIFLFSIFLLVSESWANVNDTIDSLMDQQDILNKSPWSEISPRKKSSATVTAYKFYRMTAAAAGGNDTCDEILEAEGLNPNDTVWQAQNPSGEIVNINAESACKVCIVGNGKPEWMCTPYDPSVPPTPVTPEVPVAPDQTLPPVPDRCDSLSDALSGNCEGPVPITPEVPITPAVPVDPDQTLPTIPPTPITPVVPVDPDPTLPVVPPIIIEVAKDVDEETSINFPNLDRERAIEIIRTIFLPRNVDAQPRAFSSYGVSLMRAAGNADCPSSNTQYNVWGSLLHSRDGEGDENDLIWNAFDSESTGLASGACFRHGDRNRWGFMVHYGQTDIEHDLPGEYESDNYGAGIFYIFQNQYSRINSSAIYSYHNGENSRYFDTLINSYGDRDSSAFHFGLAIEGFDSDKNDQEIVPFANLLLSYIDQDGYKEKGFPWYTLDFDGRQTWWLNVETGVKWVKRFLTEEDNTWGIESAVALTFLDNIVDEDQQFTYYWNQTLGIPSKGDEELGGALRFGLFWKPKDPNAWRVSASVDISYLSDQMNHSTALTFIVPFGE